MRSTFPFRAALPALLFVASYPLGMPGYDLPGLPFVSLVPLLVLADSSRTPGEAARRGFVAGTAANLLLYYWIAWTVAVPGRLGWPLGAACALLVSAFVALFLSAACAAHQHLVRRIGPGAAWLFPALWTAIEMGRVHLFTGFPWMLLGYSLSGYGWMRQAADLTGTLGLGFLVALTNVAVHLAVLALREGNRAAAIRSGAVALAVPVFLAGYGSARMSQDFGKGGLPIRIGIAQGGIDQNVKWDPSIQEETVRIYRELTLRAAKEGAGIVVWPETAAPFFYGWEAELTGAVDNVARDAGVPIVFGAPWFNPEGGGKYYNSVFHIEARGVPVGRYDKRHLVPFGEYVPLRRFLPFVSKLTAGEEDFSYGDSASLFTLGPTRVSASVCYEAVFPEIMREGVLEGADWLINVTNDAWFGDTVAPWQHLAMARMRAVELRRPMVRAANSGVSAVIDAKGDVVSSLGLFRKGIVVAEIRPGRVSTLFAKTGEMFGYSCIIIGFLTFLYAWKGTHGNRNPRGADNRPGNARTRASGLSLT